ncbi:YbgC/FadM family acyl-CoA thioesterase [Legionella spiritensis]|uniref:YbgC/FadM family acyl-CoA thioesterase n=1 Tax=Legionella spiritensis TaxID=452 RepID=UPI000F7049FB|nr:YbgC/FadM family acyl-CoA thioesterase [Legionella spiritensis]VEG89983.1 acyl-CoA thioesterase [Legionella spiritensis]
MNVTDDPFTTQIRVYAEDTDMMGIVYHANHLCFLERARTEMLRAAGWSLSRLVEQNCQFAIADVHIRFHAPAKLDDMLVIASEIVKESPCSLLFAQTMDNQERTRICDAKVKVVCIDSNMKVRRLPGNLR